MIAFVFKRLIAGLTGIVCLSLWTTPGYSGDTLSQRSKSRDYDYERVKVISRSFNATPEDVLDISNRYGKIEIETWGKAEFSVKITIKAKANSEETAQQTINSIHINESHSPGRYGFITELDKINNSSGWSFFSRNSKSFEINYQISMPSKNAVNLENKYGNTHLPDLQGKVTYDGAYGNFVAGNLNYAGNELTVRYGNANIESLSEATLSLAYGNLKLDKGTELRLTHKYGNIHIGSVGKINAEISYSGVEISTLTREAVLKLRYSGSLRFGSIQPTVQMININADYSSVVLPLDEAGNYNYTVSVHYGKFHFVSESTKVKNQGDDDSESGHNTSSFTGHVGNGQGPPSRILIAARYGNITFE